MLTGLRIGDRIGSIGHQNEIVVRSLRRLSALDYEEFEDIVATVGEVADHWDDELIREFGD